MNSDVFLALAVGFASAVGFNIVSDVIRDRWPHRYSQFIAASCVLLGGALVWRLAA